MIDEVFIYEDIVNLPHRKSPTRKPMPISDRAAQFAPFAALTGHDAAIEETARRTEKRIELDEYEKEELNFRLMWIQQLIDTLPGVSITYFVPDSKKSGGEYVTVCGNVSKIKDFERVVVMTDGTEISIDDILMIEGEFLCWEEG